jgi:hypothetical protein
MSEKEALQKAADEARKGARAARELGGYLDNYAKYLPQLGGRERAEEMHGFALNRLGVINDGLAACNRWVIESGNFVAAQGPEQNIISEVGKTQRIVNLSKPRAVRIRKRADRR